MEMEFNIQELQKTQHTNAMVKHDRLAHAYIEK